MAMEERLCLKKLNEEQPLVSTYLNAYAHMHEHKHHTYTHEHTHTAHKQGTELSKKTPNIHL